MKKSKLIRTLFILAALAALLSTLSIGALADLGVASEQWQSQPGIYDVLVCEGQIYNDGFIHFTAPQSGSYTICTHSEDPEYDCPFLQVFAGDEFSPSSLLASNGYMPRNCSVTVTLAQDNTYLIDVHCSNDENKTISIPVEIIYNGGTGSTLSEGSLWIVVAVVVAAAGGITALVIAKKKKTGEE